MTSPAEAEAQTPISAPASRSPSSRRAAYGAPEAPVMPTKKRMPAVFPDSRPLPGMRSPIRSRGTRSALDALACLLRRLRRPTELRGVGAPARLGGDEHRDALDLGLAELALEGRHHACAIRDAVDGEGVGGLRRVEVRSDAAVPAARRLEGVTRGAREVRGERELGRACRRGPGGCRSVPGEREEQ